MRCWSIGSRYRYGLLYGTVFRPSGWPVSVLPTEGSGRDCLSLDQRSPCHAGGIEKRGASGRWQDSLFLGRCPRDATCVAGVNSIPPASWGVDSLETVVVAVIVVACAVALAVQFIAASQRDATTSMEPAEVVVVFRSCFIGKLHDIKVDGDTISVTPRYKAKAPTISMSVDSTEEGTMVSVWMSHWTQRYRVRHHALWVLRKRTKFLRRLAQAEAMSRLG